MSLQGLEPPQGRSVGETAGASAGRKLNVLLSAYSCEPFRGTEAGHGWNWAYELARLGHNVFVITRPVGRPAIEAFFNAFPCPNLRMIYVDSPHLSLRFGAIRPLLECLPWQWSALAAARKLCANHHIDVVHHVTWGSLHVGSKLWRLGKPFVFGPVGGGQIARWGFRRYLRGGWALEMTRSLLVRYFTGILFNARSTVAHSSLVLVANCETYAWARRLGARHAEYMLDIGLPSSMLAEAARPSKRAGALKVLWVGRLVPRKALLLALEAIARVDRRLDIRCTIVGDGPQGGYLRDWVRQLNLGHRVEWLGQVDWKVVMRLYAGLDVFLFTSLRDTAGTQLIEAMANGLPVVTLDHQGARIAVPAEAGVKISVTTARRTVRKLARALERLAEEPATLARMGNAARLAAAAHTWDRKAASMSELYLSVVATFNERHQRATLPARV